MMCKNLFAKTDAWKEFNIQLLKLYDTTSNIQLICLCKIANSYKLDVQIFVWYNF